MGVPGITNKGVREARLPKIAKRVRKVNYSMLGRSRRCANAFQNICDLMVEMDVRMAIQAFGVLQGLGEQRRSAFRFYKVADVSLAAARGNSTLSQNALQEPGKSKLRMGVRRVILAFWRLQDIWKIKELFVTGNKSPFPVT